VQVIKDSKGGEWKIPSLTLGHCFDVKERAGFDFLDSRGKSDDESTTKAGELLAKLYHPRDLGMVLWTLLESQAMEQELDERAFAYLFDDEASERARMAIIGAIVDFIHPRRLATTIKADLPGRMAMMEDALIAAWKSTSGDLPG
jgi:hypothetical protein